jgi:hypothetical protein
METNTNRNNRDEQNKIEKRNMKITKDNASRHSLIEQKVRETHNTSDDMREIERVSWDEAIMYYGKSLTIHLRRRLAQRN